MKRYIVLVGNSVIVIALILWAVVPTQSVFASKRSITVAVALADASTYFLGGMNGELYYKLQSQLWKTDGTSTGTVLLSVVDPLGAHLDSGVFPFYGKHYPRGVNANNLFFFAADDGIHGVELWRTDGTSTGTFMVADIYDGNASSYPENLIAVSNLVFFVISADDYSNLELWRSDGTPDGTFFLTSISTQSRYFLVSSSVNDLLLFKNGYDIWRSDGTITGTSVLVTGVGTVFEETENKLFFSSAGDGHLWVTDGTVSSTTSLTDFAVEFRTCINGVCYFSEGTSLGLEGLWKTDGTLAGTVKLAGASINGLGYEYEDVNGTIYFLNNDELWKTDGTPAGTVFITDSLSASQFASAYGKLFFINSGQLWKSDGSATGTVMVAGFGNDQNLDEIVVLNGRLLLKVNGPPCYELSCIRGWQLYISDGTQISTHLIADFAEILTNCPTPLCNASNLYYENSAFIDEKWFFGALDGTTYTSKLWVVMDVFFRDVVPDYWAFPWVERLAETGITGGCKLEHYCPDEPVTRAQMAVFLEKGMHYPSGYTPPDVSPIFGDILGHWAEDWIEALRSDGITSGCATGLYCSENPVTRAQMAVFLLKAKYGSSYFPPAVGPSTGFGDVATDYWASAWIKQLAAEGITSGCGGGNYCPEDPVTRAQMAVFLVKTFSLP